MNYRPDLRECRTREELTQSAGSRTKDSHSLHQDTFRSVSTMFTEARP
jgi:hypothetical protein